MRLINTTPINIEQQIDDPVTSGGDIVVGYSSNCDRRRMLEDKMSKTAIGIAAALTTVAAATPAGAASLSVRDSRIGTGGTIFCSAQTLATDPVLKGMFDAAIR